MASTKDEASPYPTKVCVRGDTADYYHRLVGPANESISSCNEHAMNQDSMEEKKLTRAEVTE